MDRDRPRWWLCLGFAVAVMGGAVAQVSGQVVNATPGATSLEVKIDRAAYATPLEKLPREEIGFAGDIVSWIIARTPLSPTEEWSRADAANTELLTKVKRVPTPDDAQAVFDKLLEAMPDHQKPSFFRYSLTVLDLPEHQIFNLGGGFVYITQPLLQLIRADKSRGKEMLAFAVAHELGHIGLQHSRRGYQTIALQQEAQRGIQTGIDNGRLQRALLTTVNPAGGVAKFLFTRGQEYEADLFAIHLCRNAGFKLNAALDFLRLLCWQGFPQGVTQASYREGDRTSPATLSAYLGAHPNPYQRLKRLLLELTGHLENETGYGLFEFQRQNSTFIKAENTAVAANQRAVVFLHGMEGDKTAYVELMKQLARDPAANGLRLLAFNYPNDQSLACSGRFLKNELQRVCASCKQVDFVCHSAGGLVFRFYTEVLQGEFRKAVFQGTPHGGSELAGLRFLLETSEFFGGLRLGFPTALQQTLVDGRGQITHDLHPDSLFLQYLALFNKPGLNRYIIYRGRALRGPQAFLLTTAVDTTREVLKRRMEVKTNSPLLQQAVQDAAGKIALPPEVTDGDFCVTTNSATLRGVTSVQTTTLNHLTLKTDLVTMRDVAKLLLTE